MNIEYLNRVIVESGITIKKIADKMGISRQTLYLKMKGKREFMVSEVYALCDILRLTVPERTHIFFENEGDKNDNHEEEQAIKQPIS